MSLEQLIKTKIRQKGAISFADFMHDALYAPGYGYYSAGLQKFGIDGDFITAPELTPLFGYTLANQCQEIFADLQEPVLFEFGAGSGRLAVDLLTALEEKNALPVAYYILEVSPALVHRQKMRIEQELPHLANRVQWLDRWPEKPFEGVIIANEVLDAMPVHRFRQRADALLEGVVTLNDKDQLEESWQPVTHLKLKSYVESRLPELQTFCRNNPAQATYSSEVNLFVEDWLRECAKMLGKGAMFIIDYGFPRHEYYHPDRHSGTLMCHYQHRAHPDALFQPGDQDISAHVDFTQVAEAGYDAGFHIAGYTNQASFLLANGLLSLLEHRAYPDEAARINAQQAVKQLVQPSEMGELFKVIALTKALDRSLTGFQLQDKRASL